jgi:hypothetical protein
MRIQLATLVVASLLLGCSSSLEEACLDYCDAVAEADCPETPVADCEAQCDALAEQLDGQCEDEYRDTFECVADEPVVCEEGRAVPDGQACIEEAFALFACAQELEDDDPPEASSTE